MTTENKETTDPYEQFQPSDCVRHPKFGEGIILSRSGSSDDTKLVVSFAEEGEKRLLAAKANLKRVRPGTGEIKDLKSGKTLKVAAPPKALEEPAETAEEEFNPALDYGTDADEDEGESGFDFEESEDEEDLVEHDEDERDDY
jgi:hypothetical protein